MKKLYVLNVKKMADLLDSVAFTENTSGRYALDNLLMDELKDNGQELDCFTVSDEQPPLYRPLAVHVVPYTVIEGVRNYFVFEANQGAPTVYVSYVITPDDFIANDGEQMMSLAKTIIGKIISVFNQPHIGIELDTKNFQFPAVLQGEFVWAVEVKGENNFVVDELVKQLGTTYGRVTQATASEEAKEFNSLSKAIIEYKKEPVDGV